MEGGKPKKAGDVALTDLHRSGWFLGETGELFNGFGISESDRVLEVGCGTGGYALFSSRQGAEMYVSDLSPELVKMTAERIRSEGAEHVYPFVSDVTPLPLPDNYFSKLVAMEVLEHVNDPEMFMAELIRVGKPGAQYLLTVPDPVAEKLQFDIADPSYFQKPGHIRIFERDDFSALVQAGGLTIESVGSYGFYGAFRWILQWACTDAPEGGDHPILKHWDDTWAYLIATEKGLQIKHMLDEFMPKCQVIVARKPET